MGQLFTLPYRLVDHKVIQIFLKVNGSLLCITCYWKQILQQGTFLELMISLDNALSLPTIIPIFRDRVQSRGLGGVVVSVLATGPKGCSFKTRPRRWIFKGDKNPQHTFLSGGK
jgi:hypothetical protein